MPARCGRVPPKRLRCVASYAERYKRVPMARVLPRYSRAEQNAARPCAAGQTIARRVPARGSYGDASFHGRDLLGRDCGVLIKPLYFLVGKEPEGINDGHDTVLNQSQAAIPLPLISTKCPEHRVDPRNRRHSTT